MDTKIIETMKIVNYSNILRDKSLKIILKQVNKLKVQFILKSVLLRWIDILFLFNNFIIKI